MIMVSTSPLLENNIRLPIILAAMLVRIKDFSSTNVPKQKYAFYCVLIAVLAVSSLVDVRNVSPSAPYSILNVYFPICITYGLILSSFYKLDELMHYVGNVAFVGACFSLIGMCVILLFPQIIQYFPNYTYGGYTHKTAFVFNVLYADGLLVARNAGFAREPGVFQLLLNLGVLYESNRQSRFQLLKLIILGIAIVFTRSTIGLIIYAIILLKVMKSVPGAKYVVAAAALVFSAQLIDMINYQLNVKLVGTDSFDARFSPMMQAFSTGVAHPLGLGNTGYTDVYETAGIGSFDSFSQVLMRYGYIPFAMILFLYMRMAKENLFLFSALFLTSLSQNMWFEPLMITLLFIPPFGRGFASRPKFGFYKLTNVGKR